MCAQTTVCISLHDMVWPAPLVTATDPHAMVALCQALALLHSLISTYHPPTLLQHHRPLHSWFCHMKHPSLAKEACNLFCMRGCFDEQTACSAVCAGEGCGTVPWKDAKQHT